MGSDCTNQRQAEHMKPQTINILQQYHPKRSSIQIFLTPNLNPIYPRTQTSSSSVICEKGINKQNTIEKQTSLSAEIKMAKEKTAAQTKQPILQELETRSTFQGQKDLNIRNQRVQNDLNGSFLSKRNIQLNIELPSQMSESLMSQWNKSNFNEAIFFKTVCFDSIFINSQKMVPSKP